MFIMLAEVLHLCAVSAEKPDSVFLKLLCQNQTHAAWVGCTLHDLIQPGFFFLVGVALPFSIASRQARGQAFGHMLGHAAGRSLILIGLGCVMIAVHPRRWVWQFDDTLAQIGLAYPLCFYSRSAGSASGG
jgi:predicted acyltransferase